MWRVQNRSSLLLVTAEYVTISVLQFLYKFPPFVLYLMASNSWNYPEKKKKRESVVATCEITFFPLDIQDSIVQVRFCPWDISSDLNCLCTACVLQQPAGQFFSLSLLCMLVLGRSEVPLNQNTSSKKLLCLLCFGIWQMWPLVCCGQPWIWHQSSRELQGPLQSLLHFNSCEQAGRTWQLH